MPIQKSYRSFCRVPWRRVLHLSFAVLSTAVFVQAAFAQNITVGSPLNGTTTQSPLLVKAHNVGCNGLAPTAFAFMIDNNSTAHWGATPYDIEVTNTSVSVGKHTHSLQGLDERRNLPRGGQHHPGRQGHPSPRRFWRI